MKGDEARVVAAFCAYLTADGWAVQTGVKWVDVVARRDGRTIYAEVKGRAGPDTGTALDILYGQLLRRMEGEDVPGVRYAVVVPDVAVTSAQRVPAWVRARLRIDVYVVTEDDQVTLAAG
ncbi:hypothetical protein SAMN05660748_1241 [Blastococcus aggregatus]|uniref:Endonuclease n=1 Tax=Blastococcus aggregatus TaxID=38502 RepID=A0A285V312_9ACTN|nr:hypothetical protein [Blastococcus aggregatus]SOC48545.1 hypothetical protein SAMN05660748_1241 [Blastococcus aggregatus]